MEDSQTKSKRIFKNTLYMYARMFVMMVISLFTARVVFNTLGVNDYGTYNVVGSIIVFFSFLNNGLSTATKRYITAEIGKGTVDTGRHVFNTCIVAHLFISLIVFVLAETVGLWGVNYILNIPEDRIFAANVVYQFSVFSTVLGIMQSPFGSAIVAYERMNIFAYFTIFDAVNKLLIIYLIQVLPGDKLIDYGALLFVVSVVGMLIYRIYCYRNFEICKWKRPKDKPLLKQIFSFTSWSLLGQAAVVGTNQGVTVLVNYFFNVAVNAAMGVSSSIIGIINGFVSNFQAAFDPQIVKSYVTKDYAYLENLILRCSKISSFLMMIFLVPVYFEIDKVLYLWLGKYPQYSVEFCRWTLVCIYLEALSAPLWMLVYAQTKIKRYQVVLSSVYGMNFVIGWIFLLTGLFPPYVVIQIRAFIFCILLFIRLYYAKYFFPYLQVKKWMTKVFLEPIAIFAVSFVLIYVLIDILPISNRFLHIITITGASLLIVIPSFFFFVFEREERRFVVKKVVSRFTKIK